MNIKGSYGLLYIVATPIGNLEDITLRALRVLNEVDLILAEDTRVTAKLLTHYDIDTHILSYHQYSKEVRKLEILTHLISGKNIALVTDAGTPGISDPGNELISFLLEKESNIKVVPIPGPSAIVTALSASGMHVNQFTFLGFLPKKKRSKLFDWLKQGSIPFAFYESPHRIIKTLEVVKEEFSDPEVFVGRELTKQFESLYRGKASEVEELIKKDKIKGEIVVIISSY